VFALHAAAGRAGSIELDKVVVKRASQLLTCFLFCVSGALVAQEARSAPTGIVGDVPGCIADGPGRAVTGIDSSAPLATPVITAPERIRVSPAISRGRVVKRVNPAYPQAARRGRIEGNVALYAIISRAGDISAVDLVCGHPLLAPAAIEAVKQWKYKPYLFNGKPVEVDTQIQVNFSLSEN